MKTIRPFLFLSLLVYEGCTGQTSNRVENTQPQVIRNLTIAEMQADFDLLRKALEEAHGGLYRFSSKSDLNKRFDIYRVRLNNAMNQREFISILSEMLAEVRDGHMRLEYDEATNTALANARLFPLRILMEDTRLMVLFNNTPDDSTIKPGMEILSINGHTVADLIGLTLPKLSGDGFIETGKKKRLERSFAQQYWLFVDQSAEFIIAARDTTGKIITAKLTGALNAERENNRSKNVVNAQIRTNVARFEDTKENISLRFMNGFDIASLRIRSFGGQDFYAAIDSAFLKLHDQKTRVLILDLRGNGGGVDEYGAFLVSQFTNKPFRYFDHIHIATVSPSFATWKRGTSEELRNGVVPDPGGGYLLTSKLHSGVAEQSPAKYPFLGKLFVLLDGGTFSTAADVTAMLRYLTKASFIGQESGGAYEGNTSGLNALIALPNSKLKLKIQMYGYWNAVSGGKKGRGTLPDYPIETRVIDLLGGVDGQWNQATTLASTYLKN